MGLAFTIVKEHFKEYGIKNDFNKWISLGCGIAYYKSRVNKLITAAAFISEYKKLLLTSISMREIINNMSLMKTAFAANANRANEWKVY